MQNKIEIKQVSEKELWVGENQSLLIEENIIQVISIGEQTTEIAKLEIDVFNRLASLIDGKVNVLVDLNKTGKSSHEARKIWNQLSEGDKTNKVALFGLHPVARVIASFVMAVSKKTEQQFFKTKEEALKWLLE